MRINRYLVPALAGASFLAGCVTMPAPPRAIEAETIAYETSSCHGFCPVYRVVVQPDGRGMFEGRAHTAVTGTRAFTLSPAAYRAFAAVLAPYRPAGERRVQPGTPDCRNAPTDMPGADVRWTGLSGATDHLVFYNGCRAGNEALATALKAAPDALPIGDFIGRR